MKLSTIHRPIVIKILALFAVAALPFAALAANSPSMQDSSGNNNEVTEQSEAEPKGNIKIDLSPGPNEKAQKDTSTEVIINGESVPVPEDGVINKSIPSDGGQTNVDISTDSDEDESDADNSSSINIHVESSSTNDGDQDVDIRQRSRTRIR